MKPESFCFWLQGLFEGLNPETDLIPILTPKQLDAIRINLNKVFQPELPALPESNVSRWNLE